MILQEREKPGRIVDLRRSSLKSSRLDCVRSFQIHVFISIDPSVERPLCRAGGLSEIGITSNGGADGIMTGHGR
jgi:hypothetical protein